VPARTVEEFYTGVSSGGMAILTSNPIRLLAFTAAMKKFRERDKDE
jgi:hypothetical protein